MGTLLDNRSVVQDDDSVHFLDGAEAMSDHDRCAVLH